MKSFGIFIAIMVFILQGFSGFSEESWTYLINANDVYNQFLDGDNLWIATEGGSVIRYDIKTNEIEKFTRANGIANHIIYSIKVDGQGNPWCTSEYGVFKYESGTWNFFDEDKGLPESVKNKYYYLALDRNGDIWVYNFDAIYFFNGDQFEKKFDEGAYFMDFDNNNVLWKVVLFEGVSKYENEEWFDYNVENGLPNNDIRKIFFDSAGNTWLYVGEFENQSITRYDGETMTTYKQEDGGFPGEARDMAEDSQGNLWFACWWWQLNMFDGENWTMYTKDFLYPDWYRDYIYCNSISIAPGDSIWVGTNDDMINFSPGIPTASHYDLPEDYPIGGRLKAIGKSFDGTIWLGVGIGGIISYDGSEWTTHFGESSDNFEVVKFAFQQKGDVWVAVRDAVRHYADGEWEIIDKKAVGIDTFESLRSIFFDKEDNLWVITAVDSAYRFDGENWVHIEASENEPDGPINSQLSDGAVDANGNIWLGGKAGVSKYDGEKWEWYTKEDGLIHDWVSKVFPDDKGYIWFGTSKGISRFDGNDEWVSYTADNGLLSNSIKKLYQTKNGDIWIGTSAGANRFDGKAFTSYTWHEGLADNDVIDILEDDKGNIWFVTSTSVHSSGISILHPEAPYPVLNIYTDKGRYQNGDTITVSVDGKNEGDGKYLDLWLVMLDPALNIYFAPVWDNKSTPVISNIFFATGFDLPKTAVFEFSVPNGTPPISSPGNYIAAVGLTDAGTMDFFHIDTTQFEVAQ